MRRARRSPRPGWGPIARADRIRGVTRAEQPGTPTTVVVCTLNRRASCLETLESLARQDTTAFTVLVVDNGGRDGTAEAVAERARAFPVPLQVVVEPRPGASAARNRALAERGDDLLIFLDDDVTCSPGLVAAFQRAFADPRVAAAGGRIVLGLPEGADDLLLHHAPHTYGGPWAAYDLGATTRATGGDVPMPFGGNMAIRAPILRAIGGFRDDIGYGTSGLPGEDTALFRKLEAEKELVLYVADAAVIHRFQREKMTREYFLAWYRSQGRSAAFMSRGDRSSARRAWSVVEESLKLARYGVKRALTRDERKRFSLSCKLERARGKLTGLVHAS